VPLLLLEFLYAFLFGAAGGALVVRERFVAGVLLVIVLCLKLARREWESKRADV
jgi:hypothetical protein